MALFADRRRQSRTVRKHNENLRPFIVRGALDWRQFEPVELMAAGYGGGENEVCVSVTLCFAKGDAARLDRAA